MLDAMITRNKEGGSSKYLCQTCGKPMADKTKMRRHVEVHLVGMSFSCELCGKHSKSTHGLYQHKSKCHPELKIIKQLTANYKCNICGKGSKTDKGLANHKWKYHRGHKGGGGTGEMEMKLEQNMMSLLASDGTNLPADAQNPPGAHFLL